MMTKSWNVRDQTEKNLTELLEKKYKEIENDYKLLRKVSEIETAKKMVDEIWQCKSFANAIELELIRRGFYNTPYRDWETDRKSTRLNSSHRSLSRMPSSA